MAEGISQTLAAFQLLSNYKHALHSMDDAVKRFLHIEYCVSETYQDFGAGGRYQGYAQVITSHRKLWYVVTYPCPR